jgi:hypothetical protein
MALSALEQDMLRAWLGEQRRYDAGNWDFSHTLVSRVSYLVAKSQDELLPTHLPKRFDTSREFDARFKKGLDVLVRQGLLKPTKVSNHRQPRGTFGYKQHQRRGKDYFLTREGRIQAEGLVESKRPQPDGDVGFAEKRVADVALGTTPELQYRWAPRLEGRPRRARRRRSVVG